MPLIGRADWNNCLNLNCFSSQPGESFQTTGPSEGPVDKSIFIGGMFVKYGRCYAQLCRRLGFENEAWELYRKISPAYIEDISEIHKTEPYVYSQMIAGIEGTLVKVKPNSGRIKVEVYL